MNRRSSDRRADPDERIALTALSVYGLLLCALWLHWVMS